jgi:riboflavin biosynthesis pyrimidine reductase
MTARIDRLWPDAADNLSDDDLVAGLTTAGPTVRMNFVSSVDGSSTHDGLSGGLSGAADKRHFELLRRLSDVVLVGAGTVRSEGYGPMLVSDATAAWRVRHGMPEHPVFAIVSGSLDLDTRSRIFSEAPVRPIVVTSARASGLAEMAAVADVVVAGDEHVDLAEALRVIRERGLEHVLCEGGPSLFGSLIAEDLVDELCLTVEPSLEAGDGPRIARGSTPSSRGMRLAHVLRSGDSLLLRYVR